jgi:hypothetical protein
MPRAKAKVAVCRGCFCDLHAHRTHQSGVCVTSVRKWSAFPKETAVGTRNRHPALLPLIRNHRALAASKYSLLQNGIS